MCLYVCMCLFVCVCVCVYVCVCELYLRDEAARLCHWYSENQMKGNTNECHL